MTNYKKILTGTEAREKLLRGIDALADTVKTTLGPKGKTVLFQGSEGKLIATKDGVSVARQIKDLEDPFENYGALLARQAAEKTLLEVGDGTTTSTILAQAFIREGLKFDNLPELREVWTNLKNDTIAELKKMSKPCKTKEDLVNVATISANNDRKLGELIAKAIKKVGENGVITVEDSVDSYEDSFESQQGMQFNTGYADNHFRNHATKAICEFNSPTVLVLDESIESPKSFVPLLEKTMNEGKSLIIFYKSISDTALNFFVTNARDVGLRVCLVQAPGEGENQRENLADIASLCNTEIISTAVGKPLSKIDFNILGSVKKSIVSFNSTVLVAEKGSNEKLKDRLKVLNSEFEKNKDERLKKRIARLNGCIGTIKVGKATDIELKEKKDRIEDALFATTAALEDGILPGAGRPLRDIAAFLEGYSEDIMEAFYEVCASPRRLLASQGVENVPPTVIDPTKVTITALENALSLALTVLSIDAIIVNCEKGSDLLTLPDLENAMKSLL